MTVPDARTLAEINAILVTLSGGLIVAGILLVRRGNRQGHAGSMLAATALLSVFLLLYLLRFSLYGITPFPGPPWARWVYYPVLVSHVLLAAVSTPLVLVTLVQARRGAFARHRRLGRLTFPLWLYVAATGPLVYLMLYRWF